MEQRYIVLKQWEQSYPDPIILKKGDIVIIDLSVKDDTPGWENWVWCTLAGGSVGWVPTQILQVNNTLTEDKKEALVLEDYSANELTVVEGEILVGSKVLNGWVWCKHQNVEGWVPLDNVRSLSFLDLAKHRCTIRSFMEQSVEKQKLDYILEAGRVAPTACNKQPQRIIVVQNPDNILKVQKAYKTFGSQCVMIICRDTRDALIRPFDNKCSGDLDMGIITDHMMLAAREVGVGSVMVGLFDPEIIRSEFAIPDYIEPTALLILGYPRKRFLDANRHATERKVLNYTVMAEGYSE